MFRPAFRAASGASARTRAIPKAAAARRFISTAPRHQKSRSWKSSGARWAAAIGGLYWYNTAAVFAEEPGFHAPPETSRENEQYASVASISEERKAQARSQPPQTLSTPTSADTVKTAEDGNTTATGSPEALEEEAGQQGAFNEETGEINWDCPCLGGMAYGPCGEQFRAAFSCFVFSKEEPKGVDCIENFKTMQNCFREHPDVYGGELDEDEEPPPHQDDEQGQAVSVARDPAPQTTAAETQVAQKESAAVSSATSSGREDEKERVRAATNQVKEQNSGLSESDAIVPKAWHDGKE